MDSKKEFLIKLFGYDSCKFSEHNLGISVLINNLDTLNTIQLTTDIEHHSDKIKGAILARDSNVKFSYDDSYLTSSSFIIKGIEVGSWKDIDTILISK